jgi:hypothetical protein
LLNAPEAAAVVALTTGINVVVVGISVDVVGAMQEVLVRNADDRIVQSMVEPAPLLAPIVFPGMVCPAISAVLGHCVSDRVNAHSTSKSPVEWRAVVPLDLHSRIVARRFAQYDRRVKPQISCCGETVFTKILV